MSSPHSTDRGQNGSKRLLISDGKGIPLAVIHTGANVHDSQQAIPLVDAIPAIKCPRRGRRRKPDTLYADRTYDAEAKIRKPLRPRRIIAEIEINTQNTAEAWENFVPSSKASLPKYSIIIGKDRFEKRDDSHQACFFQVPA